jgi:hypothetical protein
MTFEFRRRPRQGVSLLISIAGPSGSGKTFSALKVARGLAGALPGMMPQQLEEVDGRIACIDTEAGRMLHYATAPGELPTADTFAFCHGDLHAPFTPERYVEAITRADEAGFKVIVVDSFTHIWEGEGGVKDMQKQEVKTQLEQARQRHERYNRNNDRPFDEKWWSDKLDTAAWDEPKNRYKRAVNRIMQCRAHVIVCLRAEEKLQIIVEKDENGREKTRYVHTKDLPEAQRWVPLIERRFHYEPLMSLVLSPTHPGFPLPIKLQEQHKPAVPLDKPLSERTGELLAAWAEGGELSNGTATKPAQVQPAREVRTRETAQRAQPAQPARGKASKLAELHERAIEKCKLGRPAWNEWVRLLNDAQREALSLIYEDKLRPILEATERQGEPALPGIE